MIHKNRTQKAGSNQSCHFLTSILLLTVYLVVDATEVIEQLWLTLTLLCSKSSCGNARVYYPISSPLVVIVQIRKTQLSNLLEVKMQEPEFTETTSKETTVPDINSQTGTITKLQPPAQSQEEWLKYGEQISSFLATLPEYVGSLFNRYKQPLVSVGLILGALVAVRVLLAILDALNDIPLVAPTFELIGIGYSAWFVYRYLLKASTRRELTDEITTLKSQVVGKEV